MNMVRPQSERAVPPLNYEAEQALLGAILANNAVMTKVSGWLRPEHFADALHGRIYEACGRLIDRGERADPLRLKVLFDQDAALVNMGGWQYLVTLTNAVVTIINADDYGRTILDLWRRRQLLAVAEALSVNACDPEQESEAVIADLSSALHALTETRRIGGGNARDLALEVVEMAQQPSRAMSTGLPGLDAAMAGGLWPGRAYALRGQTKAGKSALSGTIAYNLNQAGHACLYLAFEMTPHQLARRNLARALRTNGLNLLPGARVDVLVRAAAAAADTPSHAYYEPMAGRGLEDAVRLIREHLVTHRIAGVFVDYVQLVRGETKGEGKPAFLERMIYDLIALCSRHDLWIVFLSQQNREGQTRWGDGLNFAVDQMFTLYRHPDESDAALIMDLTRDTPYRSVGAIDGTGSVTAPGLWFRKEGPYFEDAGDQPQEDAL